jgi:hypothetical protein
MCRFCDFENVWANGLNILDVLIWKFIRGFAFVEGDMAKENLPCPLMWHQKDWWAWPYN